MKIEETLLILGTFNVVHSGHIRMFKYARRLAKKIIIGVFADTNRLANPYIDEESRIESIRTVSLVDESYLVGDDIASFLLMIQPNIILMGAEFSEKEMPESVEPKSWGGRIEFYTQVVPKGINEYERSGDNKNFDLSKVTGVESFRRRRNISHSKILKLIDGFKNLNVCVIGDVIVDNYVSCSVLGLSAEDESIVYQVGEGEQYLGGAAIVAAHCSSLGARTSFFSSVGGDEPGRWVESELTGLGVRCEFRVDLARQTTVKTRYKSSGRTVFRLSDISPTILSQPEQMELLSRILPSVQAADLLIFADFSYGFISKMIARELINCARINGVTIAADCQVSSQVGDLSKYTDCDLITPTEREARFATRCSSDGLAYLIGLLKREISPKNMIMTLGEEGLIAAPLEPDGMVDQLPAFNGNAIDISGAGDSLLTASAMGLCQGASIWEASYLGSLAAAVQVSRIGNSPLKVDELERFLK